MTTGESPAERAAPTGAGPSHPAAPPTTLVPIDPWAFAHAESPPSTPDAPIQHGSYGSAPYAPTQYRPVRHSLTPPPVPLPPAPRRRRWLRWVLGAFAVLLVCGLGGMGALAGLAVSTGALDREATWVAGKPEFTPPALNATDSQWRTWVRAAIDDTVRAQATALLEGDEAGFLASVDPKNSALIAEHRRRFKVLRALGPGGWTETVSGVPRQVGSRSWTIDLRIAYCFGPAPCESSRLEVKSEWSFKNDKLVMVDLKESDEDWLGPRPWESDDLTVVTGKRVIVASTKVNAHRLLGAVRSADAAAVVADKFAKWHDPPSRYVIFLASPGDWTTWYGHDQPAWAAAWAVPVGDLATEVVVRAESVPQYALSGLLAHELTHVTTLAGARDGMNRHAWWLIEGIAEYAQFQGTPVRQYDAFSALRTFVRGRWNGDIAVMSPTSSSSLTEASGRYGVSYLAIRRISEKYGEAKMLNFWGKVVHDGDSFDEASRAALGTAWSTVKADCARYVRSSVA